LNKLHQFLQFLAFLSGWNVQGNNELEYVPRSKYIDTFLPEELVDIADISPKKVQSMRVVVLDRLRHIDHVDLIFPVQHIVLTQIGVDQLALLIEDPHNFGNLKVNLTPPFNILDVCVFEPGSIVHIFANEIHHQYIRFDKQTHGASDDSFHSFQVPQLFLGPHTDHFSRVARTISSPEPELSLDIAISILEHKNGRFVYFDCVLFFRSIVDSMVDVGFLSCRQASVDLVDYLIVEQFEQYSSGSFVEHLFDCRTISFVFILESFGKLLLLTTLDLVLYLVQVDLGVQLGEKVFMVYFCFPFGGLSCILSRDVVFLFMLGFDVMLILLDHLFITIRF
jgi:hypothetical protein